MDLLSNTVSMLLKPERPTHHGQVRGQRNHGKITALAVVVDAATYDVVEQDARTLGIADAPADGPGSKVLIVYKRQCTLST